MKITNIDKIVDTSLAPKKIDLTKVKVLQTFCPVCQEHFVFRVSDNVEIDEGEYLWIKKKLEKILREHEHRKVSISDKGYTIKL